MQAAKYRLGDHWSQARSLDRPWHRRILSKPKMRQRSVVVGQVLLQHSTQMPFVQDNHMIQAISSDCPNYSFTKTILPRRPAGDNDLFNTEYLESISDQFTINSVPIPNQIPRCRVKRKRLDQLQARPIGSWICCDVEVNHSSSVERQDQEYIGGVLKPAV